ncbi:hypothetical protein DXG03_003618 [Asterophora parasitica]|uniref:Uncharacterized protein n=1 Tax=Asterophora parasitica TaxID=117018 RepID=A0A9P7G3F7_9AGAR|nr:hypothetical protein DXG03_003618 [Asterophora parasitica]
MHTRPTRHSLHSFGISSAPLISIARLNPSRSINNMTGSFDAPLPEATSIIPSSIAPSDSNFNSRSTTQPGPGTSTVTSLSTITVGTLSTSLPPLPTLINTKFVTTQIPSFAISTQTRFTTSSFLPSSLSIESGSTITSAPATTTSSLNGARGSAPPIPALAATVLVLLVLPLLLPFF